MLDCYRVIDLTDHRGEIGPMLLGDLGADVIRVEPPSGSAARTVEPTIDAESSDQRSLSFLAFNRNKRSIALDPSVEADRATFEALVQSADFIFESAPGSVLAIWGYDVDSISALNDQIVHVRISPFGDDEPYSEYVANDLVLAAMGGPVSLQGPADRAPVRVSVTQVWRHAGVEAAAGALVAHRRVLTTGEGQYVDVSAQSAMTWTMLQAMDAHAIQGFDFERAGSAMGGIDIVHPCADGYLVALPMSQVIVGLLEPMIAAGVIGADAREIDWDGFDMAVRDPDAELKYSMPDMIAILRKYFLGKTKAELLAYGIEHDITLMPVNTLEELIDLEHLGVRDYWRDVEMPTGQVVRSPGLWVKRQGEGAPLLAVRSEAPKLDEHGDEIRAELATRKRTRVEVPAASDELPFEGVNVADFAWVGVGPISAKYLADHGATVVRVESENRPDVLRGAGPFKDAIPGWNRSQFYGDFNTSKRSLALDLKSPVAIDVAKDLIRWSDVLIESFAPGAMIRMGLDYAHVRELNPGIIMVSTCLMGQTGPAAKLAGYGYHAAALAGFYEVTGWPDLPPSGPWVAYTDTIAPRFISVLLAAALDRRRRTGEGCLIDLAQLEASLHFLGPEILDLQVSGHSVSRLGNRSRFTAPESCYPAAGEDQWVAIAVETDAQWQALLGASGIQAPAGTDTNAGRLAHHDAIDEVLSAWTKTKPPREIMAMLQAVGVPAGVVQRSSDLLADPQYRARNFYRHHEHGEMGDIPYAGHQYRIRGYDSGPRGPAPMLGEHSFEVLTEVLGFSEERISEVYGAGVIV